QEDGFLYVNTPIITASDCEGAGEMFRVSTIDPADPPRGADGGLMRDSVEEKIRVLQKQKEATATGVLGEEGFAKSLTRDDLSFLFETAAG
ncbi:MAG: hypothetical protein AAGH89_08565, partial [Verrucomicrobiota bacterium]